MTNLMVVTHGPLAEAIKESSRMFFGDEADTLHTIGLFPTENPEKLKDEIEQVITAEDKSNGFLIFTDIFGGSPFNMAAMAIEELKDDYQIECFAGVNMPLIMEALSSKNEMDLEELTAHLEELASTTIVNVKKTLEL